jgi:hypothetical protein
MSSLSRAPALAPVLALFFLTPVVAGTIDTLACKRDLTAASAGVTETLARLKGAAKADEAERCAAYRQQFMVVVRARAIFANCKTGADREADVGRLDGTIEDINGNIATSCEAQ